MRSPLPDPGPMTHFAAKAASIPAAPRPARATPRRHHQHPRVSTLSPRASLQPGGHHGSITLRYTYNGHRLIMYLVSLDRTLAAIDAATCLDPRERGVGEHALVHRLEFFRTGSDSSHDYATRRAICDGPPTRRGPSSCRSGAAIRRPRGARGHGLRATVADQRALQAPIARGRVWSGSPRSSAAARSVTALRSARRGSASRTSTGSWSVSIVSPSRRTARHSSMHASSSWTPHRAHFC